MSQNNVKQPFLIDGTIRKHKSPVEPGFCVYDTSIYMLPAVFCKHTIGVNKQEG